MLKMFRGVVAAVVVCWGVTVGAAEGPPIMYRDALNLALAKPVAAELALEAGHLEQLGRLKQETLERRKPLAERNRKAKGEEAEVQKVRDEVAAAMRQENEAVERELRRVLGDARWNRFEQIRLQVRGDAILADAAMQDRLGFSAGQKDEVRRLRSEIAAGALELMRAQAKAKGADKKTEQALVDAVEKVRKDARGRLVGLLTPSQRAEYERLRGAPFDVGQLKPK